MVNGDAEIYSSGTIKTGNLEIILNGSSLVALKYTGKVKVTPGEDYLLDDDAEKLRSRHPFLAD